MRLPGRTRREISGFLVATVSPHPETTEISMICGSTALVNGHGSVGRTWPTSRESMGARARLLQTMFPVPDSALLVGPMRPEISGSSVGRATIQREQTEISTTSGNTALDSGPGWVGPT